MICFTFTDFQKAAAFIHEFLLKMSEDVECAELRDTLNLALLHMQKYYRLLQVLFSLYIALFTLPHTCFIFSITKLKRHSTPVLMFTFLSLKIDQNEELSPFGLLNLKQNLSTIRKK